MPTVARWASGWSTMPDSSVNNRTTLKLNTMILHQPHKGRIFGVTLLFLMLETFVCATFAQPKSHNADYFILYAPRVDQTVRAMPLQRDINSRWTELNPVYLASSNTLFFTRLTAGADSNKAKASATQVSFVYDSIQDLWREEEIFPSSRPAFRGLTILGSGPSGDTLLMQKSTSKMETSLYYSARLQDAWKDPVPIPVKGKTGRISSGYISTRDGVTLLTMRRNDSYGGTDIYVSLWNGENVSVPVNLGGRINSEGDECTPFLDADNRTLYFSSNGHNGLGGQDVFVSRRLDDTWLNWTVPENLGPAVNGNLDETCFALSGREDRVAFFSKQVNVHNVDIYFIPADELFGTKTHKARFR